MNARDFWWDELNVEHIAEHGIEPFEAEEVVDNRPRVIRAADDKYVAYGQTDSGRYLVVVFVHKGQARVRVITARDMTRAEKSRFQKSK